MRRRCYWKTKDNRRGGAEGAEGETLHRHKHIHRLLISINEVMNKKRLFINIVVRLTSLVSSLCCLRGLFSPFAQ